MPIFPQGFLVTIVLIIPKELFEITLTQVPARVLTRVFLLICLRAVGARVLLLSDGLPFVLKGPFFGFLVITLTMLLVHKAVLLLTMQFFQVDIDSLVTWLHALASHHMVIFYIGGSPISFIIAKFKE